jgi:hypothetical protein
MPKPPVLAVLIFKWLNQKGLFSKTANSGGFRFPTAV